MRASAAPGPSPAATSRPAGRRDPGTPGRPSRPRWRWPRGPLALAVSVAVTAGGLGACGAGRNALGTNTGPCFLALPVAKRAVAGRGKLAGVRLVDIAKLTSPGDRPLRDLLALLPVPPPHDICLVAYTGRFTLGQVAQPFGLPPPGGVGKYAIAVITTPTSGLLGTFVVRHLPLTFNRAHVGF
jgi:hypothetical protein